MNILELNQELKFSSAEQFWDYLSAKSLYTHQIYECSKHEVVQ